MEEFTRVDIFDTKGAEYLFVIAYLVILIVFWNLVKNPKAIQSKLAEGARTLKEGLLRIPGGIFLSKFHTWAFLERSGNAVVGFDDFLQRATGRVELENIKKTGDKIEKGELMAGIVKNGKQLSVYSPISGKIVDANPRIIEDPESINRDPYNKGWIYRIEPDWWKEDTNHYLFGNEAKLWSESEMDRLKKFLVKEPFNKDVEAMSDVVLQDGGLLKTNVLEDLPDTVWKEFQSNFLDL